MEEQPRVRAQSVMHVRPSGFQSRASSVFKKVSQFKDRLSPRKEGCSEYPSRTTRSMDTARKSFTSEPMQVHSIDHNGPWSPSPSPSDSLGERSSEPAVPGIVVSQPSRQGSVVSSSEQWDEQLRQTRVSKPPAVPVPFATSSYGTNSSQSRRTDSGYHSGAGKISSTATPSRMGTNKGHEPEANPHANHHANSPHSDARAQSHPGSDVVASPYLSRVSVPPTQAAASSAAVMNVTNGKHAQQDDRNVPSLRKEASGESSSSSSSFVTAPASSRIHAPKPTTSSIVPISVPMPPTGEASPGGFTQGGTRTINASLPPRTVSMSAHSTIIGVPRATPPRLPSLPPNGLHRFSIDGSSNRFSVDESGRLSPSITTRHLPMPIMHLPTLPPVTLSEPMAAGSRSRLRSIPALPMEGRDDSDAVGGDESGNDDEYVDATDGADGSDEDDEYTSVSLQSSQSSSRSAGDTLQPPSARPQRSGLPQVDTSPMDLSFLSGRSTDPSSSVSRGRDETPTASERFDYFSSKLPERDGSHSPLLTPRQPATKAIPPFSGIRVEPRVVPMPGTPGGFSSSRPTFYHQASKSMTDILSMEKTRKLVSAARAEEKELERMKSQSTLKSQASIKGKGKATELTDPSPMPELDGQHIGAAPAYDMLSHNSHPLQRRRSMPTFNAATLPPPYPTFAPHPGSRREMHILPREDEGKEQLPVYSNSIYLQAIMPRKMEFSEPNIQAADRKWRRVLCVLEGTSFRVYALNDKSILGWWESKVGAGDITTETPIPPRTEKKPVVYERPAKLDADGSAPAGADGGSTAGSSTLNVPGRPSAEPTPFTSGSSTRSKRHMAASLLSGGSRTHSRSRSELMPAGSSPRGSFSNGRPSLGGAPASPRISNSDACAPSHFMPTRSTSETEVPEKGNLLKQYTLQNAESGLGNDYLKRKNVIRIRMEGEQFLLQATDVGAVVEWIEGLHAATNVALDLDLRVMPKPPMFPRRRRRRVRLPAGEEPARPTQPPDPRTNATSELSRT